jgi:hypothetical protein
MYEFN